MKISLYTISTIRQIPSATTVLLLKQLLVAFCNANFIEFQRWSFLMAYINQILYSSEFSRRSVTNSSFVCFSKICFKRQQRDLKTDQQLFKSLLTFCSTSCLTNNICIYLFFFFYLFVFATIHYLLRCQLYSVPRVELLDGIHKLDSILFRALEKISY